MTGTSPVFVVIVAINRVKTSKRTLKDILLSFINIFSFVNNVCNLLLNSLSRILGTHTGCPIKNDTVFEP